MYGIPISKITYKLTKIDPALAERQSHLALANPEARFRAAAPAFITEEFGCGPARSPKEPADYFTWDTEYHRIPFEVLSLAFSFDEITRLWFGSFIEPYIADYFKEHHQMLFKVRNSHWRYGMTCNYNKMVEHVEGLGHLALDLPDFELRLAHTSSYNEFGPAVHNRKIYLDGVFGLLVHYKGEHVLTVGFSLSLDGVLVSQVQLRKKKGNRFLYKLPKHYVDVALDCLASAFPETPVWLVEGSSAVKAIRASYGKEECTMNQSALPSRSRRLQAHQRELPLQRARIHSARSPDSRQQGSVTGAFLLLAYM